MVVAVESKTYSNMHTALFFPFLCSLPLHIPVCLPPSPSQAWACTGHVYSTCLSPCLFIVCAHVVGMACVFVHVCVCAIYKCVCAFPPWFHREAPLLVMSGVWLVHDLISGASPASLTPSLV